MIQQQHSGGDAGGSRTQEGGTVWGMRAEQQQQSELFHLK